jgi:cellulose biosynthesis protein BcsQ/predicted hydrocarbon binding protein
MEILTFYSYKGGTGRTTALANVASCLHRLGRKVVVIDLDVDAPGAADKFGKREEVNLKLTTEGGILEFLINLYDYRHMDKEDVPPPALDKLAVEISPRTQNYGGIYLLPTFNFLADPLGIFASYRWNFLVRRDDETGRNFHYLLRLLELIDEQLQPDYLLVDLTSGITGLGTAVMTAWSRSVLNFTGTNDDDLWATQVLAGNNLRSMIRSSRARLASSSPQLHLPDEATFRFLPVLSRIALFSDRDRVDQLVEYAKKNYFSDVDTWDSPLCLHSDPEVEREFFLRIPLPESTAPLLTNAQLTRDYLDLVAFSCSGEIPDAAKDSPVEYLRVSLGIPQAQIGRHRFFQIDDAQGVMVNLTDSARNVAFKVETFTAMLGDIHTGMLAEHQNPESTGSEYQLSDPEPLESSEISTQRAVKAVEESFLAAGARAGKGFGKSLRESVWKGQVLSPEMRIGKWCEFDSDVGFGKMYPGTIAMRGGRAVSGEIHVIKNFLAAGRRASDANLCRLMQGYIQGVLSEILDNNTIAVGHDTSMCMAYDSSREACVFSFAQRER